MINYYFDEQHELKPYTFEVEANKDTLPPDNALRIAPEFKDGFCPCEKEGAWVLVEDNRGKTAYNIETKEPVTIDYLGEIRGGFTLLEPFNFSKWNGKKWIVDNDLKVEVTIKTNQSTKETLLTESNQQISILQDSIDLDMSLEGDEDKLKAWKKYRVLLSRVDTNVENMELPEKPE